MRNRSFLLVAMGSFVFALCAASALAGDLNPPGAPAPTLKTLDQVQPTWDQILPTADRFKLVMFNAAVLDKETGLVWEKSPDTTAQVWLEAIHRCLGKVVGNRRGWRLPTIEELSSLVDPTVIDPALPTGHPFANVQLDDYWSATAYAFNPTAAYVVWFHNGDVPIFDKTAEKLVWCVRSGQGPDGQ